MSGQVEVGSASNPQTNDPSISQAVMDQFVSNGMLTMNGGAGGAMGVQRGGRDYNLPPPGCDPDTVKLFVGSIPPKYSAEVLRPYFNQIGEVVEISVLEGRGSGFIWYKTRAEAERAIRELDGKKPGIEPKEEHRPLEIRQARVKSDPFGINMSGGGTGGNNLSSMMSMMGMMSSPAASNFQNLFSSMGNNPTLIIQFIDAMLQQHTQQTQFLQQIRDTVCQLNNLSNSPSFAPSTPIATPFVSAAPSPTPPSLAAFGINNNNNNNARRSVDNVLYSDRQTWNNDAMNAPMLKRTSLDMSNYHHDNNNNNNNNNNAMNMFNARANSAGGAMNQPNNNAALFNMLMNNNNNNNSMDGTNAFDQVNSLLQQQQQQQQQSGDLSKMLMGMGLSDLSGMGGVDQQTLLAAVMGGGQNGGGNMVSRAMTPTTSVPEGRRSMESVPENSTMGEDFRAGNERLLRQILEDSATLEVGQENNVPMLANGGGYDSWGYGGQVVSNQC